MTLDLSLPEQLDDLRPNITVIGVGGAGGNAVNNMIRSQLSGVEFMAANTDSQALRLNHADHKIQLGLNITHGLGAGSRPDIGRAAAEEVLDEIMAQLDGTHMVFITAGMGGGTGTGAAPVIARAAREHGILTVGVVTKPFHFEGRHRMSTAEAGIEELTNYVDTLIVIPNQNLFRIANDKTTFADAFQLADDVLHSGVRGVTDLMVKPGLINLDFADIRAVMREMGKAMMGTGEASGERRAVEAAEAAISNPLLDDASMKGARGVLINITGGADMTLFEVDEAANRIRDEVDPEANIIFGATFDDTVEGIIRVSVVATGIDSAIGMRGPQPAHAAQAAASAPPAEEEPAVAATEAPEADADHAADDAAAATDPAAEPARPAMSQAAANGYTEQPAEQPRTSRWSLFGGDKQRQKPARPKAAEPFVAASPARPPEESDVPRRTAAHNPQPEPAQAPESQAPAKPGFASLFSRKNAPPPAQPASRAPIDDGTVHVLPKQSVVPKQPQQQQPAQQQPEQQPQQNTQQQPQQPAQQTSQADDTLEIPAFLRRQAR